MVKRFAVPGAVFGLLAFLPAASHAATIGQILGSPSTYDGKHVDVRGTVEQLEQKVSHKGNPTRASEPRSAIRSQQKTPLKRSRCKRPAINCK